MISAVRELVDAAAPFFELRHAYIERDSPLVPLSLAHVAHWLSADALPFAESDGEAGRGFLPRGTSNAERLRPSKLRPTAAGDLLQPALDAFAAKSSMVIKNHFSIAGTRRRRGSPTRCRPSCGCPSTCTCT